MRLPDDLLHLLAATAPRSLMPGGTCIDGYRKPFCRHAQSCVHERSCRAISPAGTDIESRAAADRETMRSDFDTEVLPLLGRHAGRLNADCWTFDAFLAAASWVSSRSFGIDSYHCDSLVPLADVFNHKVSVVELGEGMEVAGADANQVGRVRCG